MAKSADSDSHGLIIIEDDLLAEGFTSVPNLLLYHSDLSAGAKLVYIGLLSYAWREAGYGPRRRKEAVFPGQETLATDLGLGRRSVIRHLGELEEKGFVRVERRGLGKTNIYRLPALTSVCQIGTSGSASMAHQDVPHRHIPSVKKDEVETDKVSLARLLCQTMGHPEKPPKRVERDALKAVNELIEAGERPEQIARGIPHLPKYGEVYGPGFLVTTWPRIKRDLAALDQAADRAEAQRLLAVEDEEEQAEDKTAWHVIQALPAEELDALRDAARRDRPLLRDVGDNHPALQAAMIELWQERDDRQPRLMEA